MRISTAVLSHHLEGWPWKAPCVGGAGVLQVQFQRLVIQHFQQIHLHGCPGEAVHYEPSAICLVRVKYHVQQGVADLQWAQPCSTAAAAHVQAPAIWCRHGV